MSAEQLAKLGSLYPLVSSLFPLVRFKFMSLSIVCLTVNLESTNVQWKKRHPSKENWLSNGKKDLDMDHSLANSFQRLQIRRDWPRPVASYGSSARRSGHNMRRTSTTTGYSNDTSAARSRYRSSNGNSDEDDRAEDSAESYMMTFERKMNKKKSSRKRW